MFIKALRENERFRANLIQMTTGKVLSTSVDVQGQRRHVSGPGTIDFVLKIRGGPVLLVENKIDAAYSVTRAGLGQPERYQASVSAYKARGSEVYSVLLAPKLYLDKSRSSHLFDCRVSYEDLLVALDGDDRALVEAAIRQAATPYEPIPNVGAGSFFSAIRMLVGRNYPDLVLKREPNSRGARPVGSHTVYFDLTRTLQPLSSIARPRMSLQCWDSGVPSASVKIMLPRLAHLAAALTLPGSLADIGAYLRPAGRSLGVVIDTPRLDTQKPLADQADDVSEALEAALRLQKWWNENPRMLQRWSVA
jgi:hypothetical protein